MVSVKATGRALDEHRTLLYDQVRGLVVFNMTPQQAGNDMGQHDDGAWQDSDVTSRQGNMFELVQVVFRSFVPDDCHWHNRLDQAEGREDGETSAEDDQHSPCFRLRELKTPAKNHETDN